MRLVGAVQAGLLGVALSSGLAACGSEKSAAPEPSASTTARQAPGDGNASPADVATALRVIKTLAATVGDRFGSDKEAARLAADGIAPAWQRIEGTVAVNDRSAYLAFEDEFALLRDAVGSGDVTKAKVSSETIAHAVDAYLAKFPADGSTASPTPTATSLDHRGAPG